MAAASSDSLEMIRLRANKVPGTATGTISAKVDGTLANLIYEIIQAFPPSGFVAYGPI